MADTPSSDLSLTRRRTSRCAVPPSTRSLVCIAQICSANAGDTLGEPLAFNGITRAKDNMVCTQDFNRTGKKRLAPRLSMGHVEINVVLKTPGNRLGIGLEATRGIWTLGTVRQQHLLKRKVSAAEHGVDHLDIGVAFKEIAKDLSADRRSLVDATAVGATQVVVREQRRRSRPARAHGARKR